MQPQIIFDRASASDSQEKKNAQNLSRKAASVLLSRHTRMIIYKYLTLDELLYNISRLSRTERSSLKNSHIINKNRHWICTLWHEKVLQSRNCLLHKDRILHKFNRLSFLLSLVDIVNIRIDPSQIRDKFGSCTDQKLSNDKARWNEQAMLKSEAANGSFFEAFGLCNDESNENAHCINTLLPW